ncbi:hypothetical protein niasHT_024593 [Heterodera trifolii]|uniref:Uncharacterized protein n=1 Tax=Heterodera trifolii TaxID=157864 RepID=A0ABD2K7T7_9BILA
MVEREESGCEKITGKECNWKRKKGNGKRERGTEKEYQGKEKKEKKKPEETDRRRRGRRSTQQTHHNTHRVVGWVGACSLPHAHAAPNACPSSPSLLLTCARVF